MVLPEDGKRTRECHHPPDRQTYPEAAPTGVAGQSCLGEGWVLGTTYGAAYQSEEFDEIAENLADEQYRAGTRTSARMEIRMKGYMKKDRDHSKIAGDNKMSYSQENKHPHSGHF